MTTFGEKPDNTPALCLVLAFILTVTLFGQPDQASAKRGNDAGRRDEHYGIIDRRPENGWQGEWAIGGHVFTADEATEFDQTEGPLMVGRCAKVHLRNGRVHAIDSEPMRDCQ